MMYNDNWTESEKNSLEEVKQNNNPFFDMENAKDLYNKMISDFAMITEKNINTYDLMNFMFDANHLRDWVEEDLSLNTKQREKFKEIINKKQRNSQKYANKEFNIIVSLCNRSKHFKKGKYDVLKKIKHADEKKFQYFLGNGHKQGTYYYVEIDGQEVNIYNICCKIVEDWTEVFNKDLILRI